MFPLKRRRKFARINKKGLVASVFVNDVETIATVKNISASGCNIVFEDKNIDVKLNESVIIKFNLNNIEFSVEAVKVRENGYNFKFEDRVTQTKLNNEILVEYFKDTPELIPVDKKLK